MVVDEYRDARQRLLSVHRGDMGARPKWSSPLRRIDWEVSDWVLKKAVGTGRVLSERTAFFRCMGCNKIHTNAGLVKNGGRCKCGAGQSNSSVGALGPMKVALILLRGD